MLVPAVQWIRKLFPTERCFLILFNDHCPWYHLTPEIWQRSVPSPTARVQILWRCRCRGQQSNRLRATVVYLTSKFLRQVIKENIITFYRFHRPWLRVIFEVIDTRVIALLWGCQQIMRSFPTRHRPTASRANKLRFHSHRAFLA